MSIQEVKEYYDGNPQAEWDRLEEHPFEFIFTTHMIDPYIREGDRILDIGGGPGRYSVYYAKKKCDVTLIDLSDGNIALAGQKSIEYDVSFRRICANCLDLDSMDLGTFDHVFLMGPLYHLTDKNDRIRAVELALKRLKPGGILYCSFILDFSGIIYCLKSGPGCLPVVLTDPTQKQLIESVVSGTEYTGPAFTSACFVNQKQIEPFMKPFGLEKLHLFGQEGILALNENQVKEFPPEEYELWIEIAKRFLELPEYMAFSEHAMYIGRKPKQ